jgi:hypothetical protein
VWLVDAKPVASMPSSLSAFEAGLHDLGGGDLAADLDVGYRAGSKVGSADRPVEDFGVGHGVGSQVSGPDLAVDDVRRAHGERRCGGGVQHQNRAEDCRCESHLHGFSLG